MKMIIRMFCAAALVVGALSLTGCGDKKGDDKGATNTNATAKGAVNNNNTNAPKANP